MNIKYLKKLMLIIAVISASNLIAQVKEKEKLTDKFTSIFGEDWSKITFKVELQPLFDISKIETVIIPEIVNNRSIVDIHCNDVYDELANNITNIDGLTLLDRSKTKSLLKEFKFQQSSGLVNEDQIRKIGEFYGAGILIFGRIQTDRFNQTVYQESVAYPSGCKKSNQREGIYNLNVNFKIIDLKTASILFSRTIKAQGKTAGPKYECQIPPELDDLESYQISREEIGKQFRELFVVHKKEITIDFDKHSKFNDELKRAINLLEIDDFEGGYKLISEIPNKMVKDKAKSAALYNLAIIQKFKGEYEESLQNAKDAYLLNPKNNKCLDIINELKDL